MSAWLAFALLVSHLVAFGLGARIPGRRRYNAGVAAGRDFAASEHGLPRELVRPAPRRFWLRLDRQSGDDPLVTRAETRSHPIAADL